MPNSLRCTEDASSFVDAGVTGCISRSRCRLRLPMQIFGSFTILTTSGLAERCSGKTSAICRYVLAGGIVMMLLLPDLMPYLRAVGLE